MYTVYSLVAKQFLQQAERGNVYNSGRNLITIISRDLRMAGFQHYNNSASITDPIDSSCEQICIVYHRSILKEPKKMKYKKIRIKY